MPDIDPSSLSRPAAGQSTTPIAYQHAGSLKGTKTSQIIPARIDLEPLYTALKAAIGSEKWTTYKTAVAEFVLGAYEKRANCRCGTWRKHVRRSNGMWAQAGSVKPNTSPG